MSELWAENQVYRRDYPLHYDIKSKERRFLNDSFQVNEKSLKQSDKVGAKPLHVAAEMGDTEYCKFMLGQYPKAFYLPNKSGKLAIDVTQLRRQKETYFYLIKWELTNFISENSQRLRSLFSSSELIHSGKNGEIRKLKLKSNQFVAVKKLDKLKEFEGRHLQLLDSSPYIVKFLNSCYETDSNTDESFLYVFMEIISGSTLTEKIKMAQNAGKEISEKYKREYMKRIVSGLVDMKRKGVVHRDLKCDNIMVNGSNIKILDFGSSVSPTVSSISRNDYERTVQYMAPEVLHGKHSTHKADVFSAAVIFFELCTTRLRNVKKDSIDSMKEEIRKRDDLSGWKADMFDSAIAPKKRDRCDSEGLLKKPYFRVMDHETIDMKHCNFCDRKFVELEFAVIFCPDAYHLSCKDCIIKLKASGKSQNELYKKCEMNEYVCSNEMCHYVCPICMTVSHMTAKENILLLPAESSLTRLANLENIILLVLDTIIPIIVTINAKLNNVEKNTNIAKLVGAAKGIGGGLLSIAGAILIPFTMGVSTPLMIAGGALATSGSAVFLGAMGTDAILKKLNASDIADYLSMFMHACKILQERYDSSHMFEQQVADLGTALDAGRRAIGFAGGITGTAFTATALTTTSLLLNVLGSVISGITIFFDIFFFISTAKIMVKGEKSEFLQDLKETEAFLLNKRQELELILVKMNETEGSKNKSKET